MSTETLFKDRVPEAAARQLATVLASAAECHLATLERLKSRKRSAKYDIYRQTNICEQLVRHCAELGVDPRWGLGGKNCERLATAIATRLTT